MQLPDQKEALYDNDPSDLYLRTLFWDVGVNSL